MSAPHPVIAELRAERLNQGRTQDDVATDAGIAQGSISNWESGFRQPTLDALTRYARALGRVITAPEASREAAP